MGSNPIARSRCITQATTGLRRFRPDRLKPVSLVASRSTRILPGNLARDSRRSRAISFDFVVARPSPGCSRSRFPRLGRSETRRDGKWKALCAFLHVLVSSAARPMLPIACRQHSLPWNSVGVGLSGILIVARVNGSRRTGATLALLRLGAICNWIPFRRILSGILGGPPGPFILCDLQCWRMVR